MALKRAWFGATYPLCAVLSTIKLLEKNMNVNFTFIVIIAFVSMDYFYAIR